jgi:hypothetical protein
MKLTNLIVSNAKVSNLTKTLEQASKSIDNAIGQGDEVTSFVLKELLDAHHALRFAVAELKTFHSQEA